MFKYTEEELADFQLRKLAAIECLNMLYALGVEPGPLYWPSRALWNSMAWLLEDELDHSVSRLT